MKEINLTIMSKPHAHPHTLKKTPAKFHKERFKTVTHAHPHAMGKTAAKSLKNVIGVASTFTLRDICCNARWFWTTNRYGLMTTAYLCWTTGNGF